MELHGDVLDKERFEQRVAQMVEVEKRRVEEELEHFTAAGREQAKGCAALPILSLARSSPSSLP